MSSLDHLGIPGILIITQAFKPAAAAQSSALGFEPHIVWVDHPIQNRTAEELRTIAGNAFEQIMKVLKIADD